MVDVEFDQGLAVLTIDRPRTRAVAAYNPANLVGSRRSGKPIFPQGTFRQSPRAARIGRALDAAGRPRSFERSRTAAASGERVA